VSACGGATCCWDHRCINAMAGYYRVDGWTIEDLYLNFFFFDSNLSCSGDKGVKWCCKRNLLFALEQGIFAIGIFVPRVAKGLVVKRRKCYIFDFVRNRFSDTSSFLMALASIHRDLFFRLGFLISNGNWLQITYCFGLFPGDCLFPSLHLRQ
jgi:hypothetical protein